MGDMTLWYAPIMAGVTVIHRDEQPQSTPKMMLMTATAVTDVGRCDIADTPFCDLP